MTPHHLLRHVQKFAKFHFGGLLSLWAATAEATNV
jgi:hypothetical protein